MQKIGLLAYSVQKLTRKGYFAQFYPKMMTSSNFLRFLKKLIIFRKFFGKGYSMQNQLSSLIHSKVNQGGGNFTSSVHKKVHPK